jgi:hypothetical protein
MSILASSWRFAQLSTLKPGSPFSGRLSAQFVQDLGAHGPGKRVLSPLVFWFGTESGRFNTRDDAVGKGLESVFPQLQVGRIEDAQTPVGSVGIGCADIVESRRRPIRIARRPEGLGT